MNYNEVIKILKKHGHKYSNISDYWFDNDRELKDILKQYSPWYYQTFELEVRWKSEIGQACQKAIRSYIDCTLENRRLSNKYDPNKPFKLPELAVIEFTKFRFQFNDIELSIDDFASKFNTSHMYGGQTDLRGIDLSGISLGSCQICNCCFSNSNFNKASLGQVELFNCNFVKATFENARLAIIRMDKNSTFHSANFKNAFLNGINLNDHNFGQIDYIKIKYLSLLVSLFRKLLGLRTKINFRHNLYLKHTDFSAVEANEYFNPENKGLKRYVEWYVFVQKQLGNFKSLTVVEKVDLVFNLIFTKYWTSFSALIINTIFFVFVFALIYYCNTDSFILNDQVPRNFFTAFYYSISTFSSFGFGELVPKTNGMQFFLILEILFGYFTLGTFVILITRKLELKY